MLGQHRDRRYLVRKKQFYIVMLSLNWLTKGKPIDMLFTEYTGLAIIGEGIVVSTSGCKH